MRWVLHYICLWSCQFATGNTYKHFIPGQYKVVNVTATCRTYTRSQDTGNNNSVTCFVWVWKCVTLLRQKRKLLLFWGNSINYSCLKKKCSWKCSGLGDLDGLGIRLGWRIQEMDIIVCWGNLLENGHVGNCEGGGRKLRWILEI